jgi:ribokinase
MKSKIIVVGSINQDIVVTTDKIPDMGETVVGNELHYFAGGKGYNQAIAAHKLGAQITFLGKVGDDILGTNLIDHSMKVGINNIINIKKENNTGTALILVNKNGENCITLVKGANNLFEESDYKILDLYSENDILLIQNEINRDFNHELINKAFDRKIKIFFNPAPSYRVPSDLLRKCYCVIVNQHELIETFNIDKINFDNDFETKQTLEKLSHQYKINIVLTLGSLGVRSFFAKEYFKIKGLEVKVIDTTGAGDCFCGALVSFIANGYTVEKSLCLANKSAAISIQELGANSSYPNLNDLN